MDAAKLMETVLRYGADESGIQDRFAGDDALYQLCFEDFMEEPAFEALADAIRVQDVEQGFEAAHALKGCSGNLGLTPLYDAICVLVESLRVGRTNHLAEEYAAVTTQLRILKQLVAGEDGGQGANAVATASTPAPDRAAPPQQPKQRHKHFSVSQARSLPRGKRTQVQFLFVTMVVFVLAVATVGALFGHLYRKYERDVDHDSAEHLMEISSQVKVYVEDKIAGDWNIAESVRDSIILGGEQQTEEAILLRMATKRELWELTNVLLYMENGSVLTADGAVQKGDALPPPALRAQISGCALTASQLSMMYTLAVDTKISVRGSKIIAVSVVQPMSSLLEHMELSLFGEDIWAYFADSSGMVLSGIHHPTVAVDSNLLPVLMEQTITNPKGTVEAPDLLSVRQASIYQTSGSLGDDYLVVTPVAAGIESFQLFCFAPIAAVNADLKQFASRYATLALTVMLVFTAIAFFAVHLAFRKCTKKFDDAVDMRENLFELLVENTHTAFALIRVNAQEPLFVSENVGQIMGEPFFVLERTDIGMRLRGKTETETMRFINEQMRDWDGKEPFRCKSIPNYGTVPPTYFSLWLYPVEDHSSTYVGIAQDVTQVHSQESAVRDALDQADRSNQTKMEFLSRMSHDIRTPMNAIINMSSFALDNLEQPEQLEGQLKTILHASQQLMVLLQDVLDVGEIENGDIKRDEEVFDLATEFDHLTEMVSPLCAAKNLQFVTDCTDIAVRQVYGDRLRFSQTLLHLLGNAVKFTPEGGTVWFTAREIPSLRENMVDLRFLIEDNGIGIPSAFLPHIFEPFRRADDPRVTQIEGSGLGLSICHSSITAMGGTLQCESEEGMGSIFTVELFFHRAKPVVETHLPTLADEEKPFLGKRCLVAEDNTINQTIVRTLLERLGFTVDLVANGQACVLRFLPSAPDSYDIVYMDIQMPVMDGYQAAIAIRASAHPQAKTIPIVAMTANLSPEDIEKARAVGMSGYLGKPILSAKIVEETRKAIAFCANQSGDVLVRKL